MNFTPLAILLLMALFRTLFLLRSLRSSTQPFNLPNAFQNQ
ncbi:hypothetical protein PLUTE_a3463 [Pseudoalteromonas luteoviolacea DSM 6061]|nr:hypothetical protein [Pseudoalteromonas luteoviolacea DSM 6061]